MSMISRVAVLEALTAKVEAASYTPLRQTEMWAEDPPYSITEEARLPSGVTVRFITGGDSFHRGQYNGWIAAEVGGQRVGTIQYSLTGAGTGRPAYHIDMIEVDEGWRRKGIATALYERMLEGEPNTVTVDPGSLLPDGAKWWPTVSTTAQADAQGVDPDHPRLFAHKEASTPLSDERYGSPATVRGRPTGDQMIVFYNRDTDTLVFEEPMGKRPEWDFITSPNPPEGGPVKVDKEPLSITPLYNGTALALDRGYIYPATGGMNPTSPTMFSPLLTEGLARLIDTFPDYGSWTVYEAPRDWAQGGRGYTARDWVYRFLDLRSAISIKQAQWKTLTLYHGTCRRYAERIQRRGLQPRDTTGVANPWGEQYASRPGLVYLSHGSRLTVTRSAMSKAAAAAGWDLYGDAMTRLTDFRYDHSRSVAENFRSAMAKLAGAATGKPKTNWTREIPPDPEADALFGRIKSDRALDPVLLEINVPREGWGNFERDEDTRRYSDPGAEMTGMPAWMLSLGSDAVVAYKGTIPPAWISVAAEGAAASGAGMSGGDWSWRR